MTDAELYVAEIAMSNEEYEQFFKELLNSKEIPEKTYNEYLKEYLTQMKK